jgi:AcrR family transcriptional regulator
MSRDQAVAGPAGRVPVTRDLLFRRALAIIDADGLAALTMRRLAADVGVEAASLYHHVPNKQAVLDGAVSVMREGMVFDQPLPTDWRDLLELVFLRYLDLLTAHPNMLPLTARHVETDPAEGLLFLLDAGLSEDDAVAVWQSIIAFVLGYATFASQALAADVDHLPAGLAARMARWDRRTARHALQALLGAYAADRALVGEGSARAAVPEVTEVTEVTDD